MMTTPRMLTMVERRVTPSERAAFLGALAARRGAARMRRANLWVFEHTDEPGRFIEFTEAADALDVAAVHEGALPAPLWREVQGD